MSFRGPSQQTVADFNRLTEEPLHCRRKLQCARACGFLCLFLRLFHSLFPCAEAATRVKQTKQREEHALNARKDGNRQQILMAEYVWGQPCYAPARYSLRASQQPSPQYRA